MDELLDETERAALDDIRTAQEWPGHADSRTTMVDTHLLNPRAPGARSPADRL